MYMGIFVEPGFARAQEKAKELDMTLTDNPLAPAVPGMGSKRFGENMRRLEKDAKMRECPYNGSVYAGIMDTRYGG